MDVVLIGLLCALVGAAAGHLLTLARALKAERRLDAVRRRALAPLLAPSMTRCELVYEDIGEAGQMGVWSFADGRVLCALRAEVGEDVSEGDDVALVLENRGEPCARLAVELDGVEAVFAGEPDLDGSHGLWLLRYPFDPIKRGQAMQARVAFECRGWQDTHLYTTRHGLRVFDRTDPQ